MKIHVVESMALDSNQKTRLSKLGEVKYFDKLPDLNELLKRCKGADVVCCNWAPIDEALLKMTSFPKLISLPFTGVGFLPLKEAAAKGVKIANSPGAFTEGVGEFGIGMMLALMRRICSYKEEPKPELTISPYGKTILILGAGRIGSYAGNLAKALGMKVVFWKRENKLERMLRGADVVYNALPFSDQTKGLLGEKEFALMKNGAFFVSTSHSKIYDADALLGALNKNLAGAALDLEGIDSGDYKSEAWQKLKGHQKILLTPHVAFKSDYGQMRAYDIMIDNVEAFVRGKPQNIVN